MSKRKSVYTDLMSKISCSCQFLYLVALINFITAKNTHSIDLMTFAIYRFFYSLLYLHCNQRFISVPWKFLQRKQCWCYWPSTQLEQSPRWSSAASRMQLLGMTQWFRVNTLAGADDAEGLVALSRFCLVLWAHLRWQIVMFTSLPTYTLCHFLRGWFTWLVCSRRLGFFRKYLGNVRGSVSQCFDIRANVGVVISSLKFR